MEKTNRLDPLRAARFLAAILLSLAAFTAAADVSFRSGRVKVGGHDLKVEIAETEPQREQGLMYRKSLGRNEGMLFLFGEPAYHSMWMKNTLIPLSVAFIDANGEILNILDMDPETLDAHMAAGPAVYAIEANKGWFTGNRIKAGDKVTGLPKK